MFKKKESDESLPEFPDLPNAGGLGFGVNNRELQPFPLNMENNEDIHMLPSFPDSPMDKGFSQSAIKDAVSTQGLPELPDFESGGMDEMIPSQKPNRTMEMEEWKPKVRQPFSESINPPVHYNEEVLQTAAEKKKPIFVKIDKFQAARNSLETIKEKLAEVDELLKTIREVKRKEDEEISVWEKEMDYIKARINSITTDIFENPEY